MPHQHNLPTARHFARYARLLLTAIPSLFVAANLDAATINWGTPQTISTAATDVETDGTLIYAIDASGSGDGTSSVTVTGKNGVDVQFLSYDAVNAESIAGFSSKFRDATNFGAGNSDYGSIVDDGFFHDSNAVDYDTAAFTNDTIVLSGLTIGEDYLIQYWSQQADRTPTWITTIDGSTDLSLDADADNAIDYGQFVVGTFTADAVTQSISVSGRNPRGATDYDRAHLNAFQLRHLPAGSATITWGTPQTISTAATDVETDGILIYAIDGSNGGDGSSSVTVTGKNGVDVEFLSYGAPDAESIAGFSSKFRNSASFGAGSSDYGGIVDDGFWQGGESIDGETPAFATDSVVLSDLLIGQEYLIQYWVQDAGRNPTFVTVLDGTANLILDTDDVTYPQSGQFVVGTFTADATTQSISVTGTLNGANNYGRAQLNAIQLRNINNAVIGWQIEAENFDGQGGTQLETTSDTDGGQNVSHISNNNWLRFDDLLLGDNALLNFRVARNSGTDDGHIEVRQGSTSGTLLAQIDVPDTGGWQNWETISVPAAAVVGQQDIFLVFVETSTTNNGSLFNLNWWSKTPMVEAEDTDDALGKNTETTQDIGGGLNISNTADGEWLEYTIEPQVTGWHKLDFRVASPNSDGYINIVSGGQGGPIIGTVDIGSTGGWQTWQTVSTVVQLPTAGTQTLRLELVIPTNGFNVNWFSYEPSAEPAPPLAITVGNTPKQKMRYGIDYERLWFWTGAASLRDRFAEWSVADCDVDYVRVAINAKYELTEGVLEEDAYWDNDDSEGGGTSNDRIIPMMQDMQAANPDIKFFASPRPLNEAVNNVAWQPYPQWITGSTGSGSSFSFDEVKCSQYLLRYLILMKHHGFKISYMDLTNEWNVINGTDFRDISALFDDYVAAPAGSKPVIHPDYPTVTLVADDIPQLVGPSAWSYSQGDSWLSGLYTGLRRDAVDIASCHNTDKGGTAQDFVDQLEVTYAGEEVPEAWNTELHGWKSTSNADEVLTYAYMMECINAGFSGISGWLAVGTPNQGHCYIVNSARSVKYYMFEKLTNTSNRGYALEVNEPDELKVYWDSDPDQADADSAVSALIRGNLMTVWVLNHSDTDYPITINPTGRTISDYPIKSTRWSQFDGLSDEGVTGSITKDNDTSFTTTAKDNSAYCFEILLEPESGGYVRIEAEDYDSSSPAAHSTETTSDIGVGLNLSNINDGNWTSYDDIDLSGATNIRFRIAAPSGNPDGEIEIRTGSQTGPVIGRTAIPVTGGWQTWCTIETPLHPTSGTHDLYLVYTAAGSNQNGSGAMFNLNWFELVLPAEVPSNITEAPVSGTSVTLNWDAVPHAIGYTVKRSTTQGGPYTVIDDTVTDTSYTDNGLTAGTSYYYVIVTRYGSIESDESDEIAAVPSNPIMVEDLNFLAPTFNLAGDNVAIDLLNSEPGHMYQGQERKDLTIGDWINIGSPIPGNGGSIIFNFPVGPLDTECFYRIKIERQ
ncbi:MAG: carbohydrate-binding protein [Opitutaceae bacterium]